MVDTKSPGDKTLSVPTKTLTLKPRVEQGTVRQIASLAGPRVASYKSSACFAGSSGVTRTSRPSNVVRLGFRAAGIPCLILQKP